MGGSEGEGAEEESQASVGRPRLGVYWHGLLWSDGEETAEGVPVPRVHGAGAFKEDVDVEVRPEDLEGACYGRDKDGQARAGAAHPALSLLGTGGGKVLTGWSGHNEEQSRPG